MTTGLQQERSLSDPTAARQASAEPQAEAASHLAHDARNWLTVLQVYCDLLRNSGMVAGAGRTWMEELSQAVERGQGLVTSLLDTAQNSAVRNFSPEKITAVRPKALDLASVLAAREPVFRQLAGDSIRVESKIAARARTTALREAEFDRILMNLVRNAIDAMPQGGRLTIELEHNRASQRRPLVLRVSDTGTGIPADVLPSIFDSGFSTKPSPKQGRCGRGFGLAIVRKLTLAAGGSIQVRSRVGHGSCVTLELPLEPAQRPPHRQRRSPQGASSQAVQASARTRQINNFGAVRKGTRVPC